MMPQSIGTMDGAHEFPPGFEPDAWGKVPSKRGQVRLSSSVNIVDDREHIAKDGLAKPSRDVVLCSFVSWMGKQFARFPEFYQSPDAMCI